MVDTLATKHGKCPITYQRSASDPLDCIFSEPIIHLREGGCLPFSRLISDHRGVWIEIPNELIFGYNLPTLSHPNARRIKIKDPRRVNKYCEILHQLCDKEQIYNRMNHLHQHASNPLSDEMMAEYEHIDEKLCSLMEKAESKCRKLHMGKVSWSPAYKKSNLLI